MSVQGGQGSPVDLVREFIGTDTTTSLGKQVLELLQSDNFEAVLQLQAHPAGYTCKDEYLYDATMLSLVLKNEDWPAPSASEKSRKKVAVTKFLEGEHKCFLTNQAIRRLRLNAAENYFPEGSFANWDSVLRIRRFIRHVLGEVPNLSELCPKFGPGSSLSDKHGMTTVPDKLSSELTLTPAIAPVLAFVNTSAWGRGHIAEYGSLRGKFVRGNRFFTVPKNALEERGAAVEPSVNGPYTCAIGDYIKDKQAKIGNNLRQNQQTNRELARLGSIHGTFATIDLRNASNTLCTEVVKLLLPDDWYELLNSFRSPFTSFDGKWLHLNIFSTMGNGFTFELEALIFLAVARESMRLTGVDCAIGENLSVHGDDIIVPSGAFDECVRLLEVFGFEANRKKSFGTGPFRESCGGDYWNGQAVRPFNHKTHPSEPHEYISLANKAHTIYCNSSSRAVRSAVTRVRTYALNHLPNDIRRLRGPAVLGDLVIWENDVSQWQTRLGNDRFGPLPWQREIAVWAPSSFKRVKWDGFGHGTQLAAALYGCGVISQYERVRGKPTFGQYALAAIRCSEHVPLRDGVTGYARKWIHFIGDSAEEHIKRGESRAERFLSSGSGNDVNRALSDLRLSFCLGDFSFLGNHS